MYDRVRYEDSDVGPWFGFGNDERWHLVTDETEDGLFVVFTLDIANGAEHDHEHHELHSDAMDEARRRADHDEPTIVGEAYCPRCDDDHEYGYVHSEDEPNLTVPEAAAQVEREVRDAGIGHTVAGYEMAQRRLAELAPELRGLRLKGLASDVSRNAKN